MSLDAELAAWVTLTRVPGLGGEGVRRLLMAFGSPEQVLAAPVYLLREQVKPGVAEAIARAEDETDLKETSDWLENPGNSLVTLADADYPQLLLQLPDPPTLLYAKGDRGLLNRAALAVVGSRHATAQGLGNAEAFSESISAAGLCIVSGLAHGIDAAAHRGGLRGAGRSIAVVGTGLDRVYPAANRDLAHEMAEKGLLISEFHLGMPPLAANFPKRNRIISGLSLGCLVVEANLQSGSLITARLALEQGREVFAIPGSIHSPQSKGCHKLIKQGAKLVEEAQDILEELAQGGLVPAVPRPEKQGGREGRGGQGKLAEAVTADNEPGVAGTSEALELLEHLGFDPVGMDALSHRSGLTIEALSAILLELELEGRVATLPGGHYQRTD